MADPLYRYLEGLNPGSEVLLSRQLHEKLKLAISTGDLKNGTKLPAIRTLASQFGWGRNAVDTAYSWLESDGLVQQFRGKGTFVVGGEADAPTAAGEPGRPHDDRAAISFYASRPSELLFPLDEFRATCREVIDSPEAAHILQLGAPAGYEPLRQSILQVSREQGVAGDNDDVLVTSGCQQGFDLLARVYGSNGETVLIEDPVYPGLRDAFQRAGARVLGLPLGVPLGGERGPMNVAALRRMLEKEHPRLLVLTPSFQNPTGLSLTEEARRKVLDLVAHAARKFGTILVENDLYSLLQYHGAPLARMKAMDRTGQTLLLTSFSKIAFPGLRVGWMIGPRETIARLVEAKYVCDLHTDQLSQAVVLQFARSGRLVAHLNKMVEVCRERLDVCLEACHKEFPAGVEYTIPLGGMNVWVRLPFHLDASVLAVRASNQGVSFMAGKYFAVSRSHKNELRLSFAGLEPEQIRKGIEILGRIFKMEMDAPRNGSRLEPAAAVV
ncbi:MAG TPA: PLP-dependent aminotransferase family protein [Bryobacteraceae bacterium]|nr:PLP-dependent aminotransferase family protein [Bryobacteraceae bacterium]